MANIDVALRRLTPLIAHLLLERTENAPRVFPPVDNRWFVFSLDRSDHLTLYQNFEHHKYPVGHLVWMGSGTIPSLQRHEADELRLPGTDHLPEAGRKASLRPASIRRSHPEPLSPFVTGSVP